MTVDKLLLNIFFNATYIMKWDNSTISNIARTNLPYLSLNLKNLPAREVPKMGLWKRFNIDQKCRTKSKFLIVASEQF